MSKDSVGKRKTFMRANVSGSPTEPSQAYIDRQALLAQRQAKREELKTLRASKQKLHRRGGCRSCG